MYDEIFRKSVLSAQLLHHLQDGPKGEKLPIIAFGMLGLQSGCFFFLIAAQRIYIVAGVLDGIGDTLLVSRWFEQAHHLVFCEKTSGHYLWNMDVAHPIHPITVDAALNFDGYVVNNHAV